MTTQTVTIDEYNAFVARYNASPDKEWYRFGQAFFNEMVNLELIGDPTHRNPGLFYEVNRKKAEQLIFETYIKVD